MDWLTQARWRFGRIGAGACVMLAVWVALNMALSMMLVQAMGQNAVNAPIWLQFLISSGPLYLIAMPMGLMLMKAVPELPTRRFPMTPGRFFTLLLMCLPIMYGGSIIGNLLSMALSGGTAQNAIADLAMANDPAMIVFGVILGPIFEEWMFRKQIISRTRRYGEKLSILLSALMFALFHLNLFQFFYAFGLGLMFGYVYMRTSQLRYSIAMHMIINFNGSVLAPWVLSQVDLEALATTDTTDPAAAQALLAQNGAGMMLVSGYGLLLIALSIAGLVLLVTKRRTFEFYTTPEQLPKGLGGQTAFGQPGHGDLHRHVRRADRPVDVRPILTGYYSAAIGPAAACCSMKSAPASARAAASAAVEGNTSNRAYTCTSAVMPYGVNPVNLTSVGTFSSRMPSVALLTTSSARRSTCFRSLPAATVNGTGT